MTNLETQDNPAKHREGSVTGNRLNGLHDFLEGNRTWILGILFSLYLLGTLAHSRETKLWFDEYLTLDVARAQSLGDMARGAREGGDLAPLTFHLITRGAVSVFGSGRTGLRVPGIAGFAVMMFSVFWFVRRRCGAVAGMIAFMIPALTEASYFSTDARPYGLVLGFLGVAAVAWQMVVEREDHRLLPLLAFGVTAALAVACHYLTVFAVLAFGLAEIYRIWRSRRIDWPLWTAIAIATLPALIGAFFLPRGLSSQNMAGLETAHLRNIPEFYRSMLDPFVLTGVLIIVLLCLAFQWTSFPERREEARRLVPFTNTEMVMALGLFLSPIPTVASLIPLHSYYNFRYNIVAVIGFCIIFTTVLYAFGRGLRSIAAIAFVVVSLCFAVAETESPRLGGKGTPADLLPIPASLHGEKLIYVNDPFLFMEFLHTWPAADASRLRYVTDRESVLRYTGQAFIESILTQRSGWHPMPLVSLEEFDQSHRPFLLYYSPNKRGWLFARLQQDGTEAMRVVQRAGDNILFLVEPLKP